MLKIVPLAVNVGLLLPPVIYAWTHISLTISLACLGMMMMLAGCFNWTAAPFEMRGEDHG